MQDRDILFLCFIGFFAGVNRASKLHKVSIEKGEEGTIDSKLLCISAVFMMLQAMFRYPDQRSVALPVFVGFVAGASLTLFARETGLMSLSAPDKGSPEKQP